MIIIALDLLQVFSYNHPLDQYSDNYYKQYMLKLEGPVTQDKISFINSEQKKFDEINRKLEQLQNDYLNGKIDEDTYVGTDIAYQNKLAPQEAFDRVKERYNYLTDMKKKTGKSLAFVYDTGFRYLLGLECDSANLENALKMLLALIGFSALMFSMEESSGAVRLIRTCYKGRKNTVNSKLLICLSLVLPVLAISYPPDIINICRAYGIYGLYYPAASIPEFESLTNINLLTCLILFYLMQVLAAVTAVFVILLLSSIVKSSAAAILLPLGIVSGPVILHLLGIDAAYVISLVPIFNGMPLIDANVLSVVQIAVLILIDCLAFVIIRCRYSNVKNKFPLLKFST